MYFLVSSKTSKSGSAPSHFRTSSHWLGSSVRVASRCSVFVLEALVVLVGTKENPNAGSNTNTAASIDLEQRKVAMVVRGEW